MKKKACILSIDGGGIRGIIPGVILSYIEKKLQTHNSTIKLSDYFDLISGTSTGGILACCYLIPDKNNKPKYTADEAVEIYIKRGAKIFDISLTQKFKSWGGLTDEKYSAKELENALDDYFGDTKLSELLKPCLITAYDIRNRKAHFFNKTDTTSEIRNFYVKDMARATSAAPTYFETARIKSIFNTPYALIDGGVFANNPAMCAYSEARTIDFAKITGNSKKPILPFAKDMLILSMGTGTIKKPYYYDKAKDWGAVQWIKPIIDIMMSGNSETVDFQLKQIFETTDSPDNYIRIQPDLYNANSDMDDASKGNLDALKNAGLKYIEDNKELLDSVVDKLIEFN